MDGDKGFFITVEGPNGVGKSTIVNGLADRLRRMGFDVVGTKEPTASDLGNFVRQIESELSGVAYACLVAADRYRHLELEVVPALRLGKVVLSDRYVESSLVLQRFDGVDLDFIWALNSRIRVPDLSVILVASPETLAARLTGRPCRGRFERSMSRAMELEYYQDAACYLSARGFNVMVLDNGVNPPEKNIETITERVSLRYAAREAK